MSDLHGMVLVLVSYGRPGVYPTCLCGWMQDLESSMVAAKRAWQRHMIALEEA